MIYLVTNQNYLFDKSLYSFISLEEGIDLIKDKEELGLDTETSGLDFNTKDLLLLQIGNFDFQVVFDIASYGGKIPNLLKDYLNTSKSTFILQNAKFDLKFLFKQDIILKKIYDTMLAEVVLTNGLQYSGRDLATLAQKYCQVELDKSVRGKIISHGLSDEVLVYGAKDVKYLSEIKRKQLKLAKDLSIVNTISLENSFVIVLAYVEYCGIKLDFNKWSLRTNTNITEALEVKKQLESILIRDKKHKYFSGMRDLFTGEEECIINWDSPKQTLELFKSYGIDVTFNDKGVTKESIDAKVLKPQADNFEIIPIYLKYKELQKEISTYGYNWAKYISPVTGRIHTTFSQIQDTGRLSCGNKRDETVNLQNIPSGEETRSCFIPEEGNVMIDADFASQEQVVLANFSQESNLLNFYAKGFKDMHSYIAFLMYPSIRRCSIEELEPEKLNYIKEEFADKRYLAKVAGFSINYGGNGSTIAKNCNISKSEGEFVYEAYFNSFPKLKEYFDLGFRQAAYFGYVEFNKVTGRKYFFNLTDNDYFKYREEVEDKYFWVSHPNPREISGKYNKAKNEIQRISQNYRIQGSSADCTKFAGILFIKEILRRNWWMTVKIVNIVHDEFLIECPEHMCEEVKSVLVNCMEEAGKPFCKTVPLKAEAIHGSYWVH